MIREDHSISPTVYALPACTETTAHYHAKMGSQLDSYTTELIAQHLNRNGLEAALYISGDVDTFCNWFTTNIREIAGACGVNGSFSYRYSALHTSRLSCDFPGLPGLPLLYE